MNKYKYKIAKFEYVNYRKFWQTLTPDEQAKIIEIYGEQFDPTKTTNKKYILTIFKHCIQDNLNILPHQLWRIKSDVGSAVLSEVKSLFVDDSATINGL